MKKILIQASLCFLITFSETVYAQTNKEIAISKAKEAIKMEDEEGKYEDAIKLLEEAQKLDPENITFPYEISYAYTSMKEYKKAANILEKLVNHKDAYGRIYQALGNAYDYQGKAEKAIETYKKGIQRFPEAGELYLELGNMYVAKNEYDKALPCYEKGIEADPKFPSNYYWAAKIFCNSSEEVWGMIYGEIFMNLERNSKRTAEISKLLFDTYKSEIKFTSDTSFGVSFSKNASIDISSLMDPKKFKLPFGMGAYEAGLMMAVVGEKEINLNSLHAIRQRFVQSYFKGQNGVNYPNVLFEFQQKVLNAGHFEPYNHWILMKGDEGGFEAWHAANKEKWENFVQWFKDNKLEIDKHHKFFRAQY